MLKWTANGPRESYLLHTEDNIDLSAINSKTKNRRSLNFLGDVTALSNSSSLVYNRMLKRKSCDKNTVSSMKQWDNKENQMTSTPLHVPVLNTNHILLRKLDNLKDLSNIVAENNNIFTKPKAELLNCSIDYEPKTPEIRTSNKSRDCQNLHQNYATTLPTFEVEYSPCGLIPGPLLALRGMGIADTYFEKPRYLAQKEAFDRTESHNKIKPNTKCEDEFSLSSSKMGDNTLERMIDAILESSHKERKQLKSTKTYCALGGMSPTYTPADDPANDLPEYWDTHTEPPVFKLPFDERELCSPTVNGIKQNSVLKLRRQRALRRKRKFSDKFSASVRNSAQKIFSVGTNSYHKLNDDNNIDIEIMHNHKINISPDSGHNSSNELEETILESNRYLCNKETKVIDATKRRLSFSEKNFQKLP